MSDFSLIPALTRNGYTRTPRTEADIQKAWNLSRRDLVAAFAIADESHPEHLCAEALVFFVRRALRSSDPRTAEGLFAALVTRSQLALRSMIRGLDEDARYDIQAEVLADLARLLTAEDDSGDFLQSRFWLYLKRRATTARAAWLRSSGIYVLAHDRDGDGEIDDDQTASNDISPEDHTILLDALGRLPPDLRELVILKHYEGWRIGDETGEQGDPADPTLAERYGITARAVRKRLAKAHALLTKDQKDGL